MAILRPVVSWRAGPPNWVVGGMTSVSGPRRMTSCRKPHTDGACKEDEVEVEDSTECPLCATDVLAQAGYADARSPSG